ncbi:shikimate dehydrogenase [Caballeronia mineralivorans PML1(12)]|uniref:Shikimate dehydrogenase n=1 Tax=Caballeronia mineralivorans PML1(12) TaxID=908627 RepID=A0A0J1CXF9_9BURK|nr:shikimate dehydrogenase [Caballeronia mineralivorans]KLU25242.1 shikimate dehydrogenase [Caballeronia mineralivorans PML1(12)]
MTIDGATRLYAIIGDPVAQVRSPSVYTELFAGAGINAVMIPAHVGTEFFEPTMRGLMALGNLDGLLITSPHKNAALSLAGQVSARAQSVAAVNALRRESDGSWTGDMFDGVGFVAAAQALTPVDGARVLLFGCGGAGAAIAAELAAEGASSIALIDPDASRAEDLSRSLTRHFPACSISLRRDDARYDIVVNASVVGMKDTDDVPGDPGPLDAQSIVGDVVLRPPERPTEFVLRALSAGARVVTGQQMHAGQTDAIMRFFFRAG